MKERDNILRIFEETKQALKQEDAVKLKQLSNQTIHTASVAQDSDNIAVAVIVYSLSKVIERGHHKISKEFYKIVVSSINNAIRAIKKGDEKQFTNSLELIRKAVNKLSGKLKKYIQDVFQRARVNKASRIYEHGISMEKTAKLFGITMYELAAYAGKTGISDVAENKTLGVRQRIKLAEEMFV